MSEGWQFVIVFGGMLAVIGLIGTVYYAAALYDYRRRQRRKNETQAAARLLRMKSKTMQILDGLED